MKRVLAILLLLLLLLLGGVVRASDARLHPAAAAPLETGQRLELYSYTILGVEVRPFSSREFAEYQSRLAPLPEAVEGVHHGEEGAPAFLRRNECVLVTRVVPGSPAEEAGIKAGEVIYSLNGTCIKSPAKLVSVMRNCQPGVSMEMLLIDTDLRWKYADPVPEARPERTQVGHIIPRRLSPRQRLQLKQHQAQLIDMLTCDSINIRKCCDEMEAISRILCNGYAPGCLQIPLRSGDCTITATRCGWNIEVTMTERGVKTTSLLRMYHYQNPQQTLNFVLPDAIRQRLREIDISSASLAP